MSPQAIAWVDGAWHDDAASASVSVLDHGLLYGDGVFEGIRFYAARRRSCSAEHLRRLRASRALPGARGAATATTSSPRSAREAIERFGAADGYLRLIVTRGRGLLGVSAHTCERPTTILIAATLELYPAELYERGVDVITSSLRRAVSRQRAAADQVAELPDLGARRGRGAGARRP